MFRVDFCTTVQRPRHVHPYMRDFEEEHAKMQAGFALSIRWRIPLCQPGRRQYACTLARIRVGWWQLF
jgi:hypothetical protein